MPFCVLVKDSTLFFCWASKVRRVTLTLLMPLRNTSVFSSIFLFHPFVLFSTKFKVECACIFLFL
jgi:hypothetical protein